MCCEHLVCASCAHPVPEAHCGVCRAARARMHGQAGLPPTAMVVLLALLAVAALLSVRLAG